MLSNIRAHVDTCLDGIEDEKWWLEYIMFKGLCLDLPRWFLTISFLFTESGTCLWSLWTIGLGRGTSCLLADCLARCLVKPRARLWWDSYTDLCISLLV